MTTTVKTPIKPNLHGAATIGRCTRCNKKQRNLYHKTGGAGLPYDRCRECYEDEVRRVTREDIPISKLRIMERKDTEYP